MARELGPGYKNGYTEKRIRYRLETMFRQGMTYDEMARRLDIDRKTVRYWLRRIGIGAYKRPVTAEERERFVELRRQRLSQREIARRVGRSEVTVRNHLKRWEEETGQQVNNIRVKQAGDHPGRRFGELRSGRDHSVSDRG